MLSYQRINAAIAQLPEVDVLTTDAYYQGGGTAQLLEMLRDGSRFAAQQQKPLLITEYGGSPHADSMGNLVKQAHLGLWTGFFNEAPSAPMFWWFALVDEKDLYGFYAALDRFSAGEDRRGLTPALREIAGKGITVSEPGSRSSPGLGLRCQLLPCRRREPSPSIAISLRDRGSPWRVHRRGVGRCRGRALREPSDHRRRHHIAAAGGHTALLPGFCGEDPAATALIGSGSGQGRPRRSRWFCRSALIAPPGSSTGYGRRRVPPDRPGTTGHRLTLAETRGKVPRHGQAVR